MERLRIGFTGKLPYRMRLSVQIKIWVMDTLLYYPHRPINVVTGINSGMELFVARCAMELRKARKDVHLTIVIPVKTFSNYIQQIKCGHELTKKQTVIAAADEIRVIPGCFPAIVQVDRDRLIVAESDILGCCFTKRYNTDGITRNLISLIDHSPKIEVFNLIDVVKQQ